MNHEEFKNSSATFKRLNPHLFSVCALPATQPEPDRRRNDASADALQKRGAGRLVISLVGHRTRILDDDNFVGGCKWLRDAIAASLGIDDGDPRVRWQYSQQPTQGTEGVTVSIEVLTTDDH